VDSLEGDFELLDALVDLSDDRNDGTVVVGCVSDALQAGEHWILQFPAKKHAQSLFNGKRSCFDAATEALFNKQSGLFLAWHVSDLELGEHIGVGGTHGRLNHDDELARLVGLQLRQE